MNKGLYAAGTEADIGQAGKQQVEGQVLSQAKQIKGKQQKEDSKQQTIGERMTEMFAYRGQAAGICRRLEVCGRQRATNRQSVSSRQKTEGEQQTERR